MTRKLRLVENAQLEAKYVFEHLKATWTVF